MRLPRKLKKKAKKRKAAHDAMVMAQAAMISASGFIQLALVVAQPSYYPQDIPLKAIKGAQVSIESAQAIQKCMSQIKHYREFA